MLHILIVLKATHLESYFHMFPSKKNTCGVKCPKLLLLDVLKITQPYCMCMRVCNRLTSIRAALM